MRGNNSVQGRLGDQTRGGLQERAERADPYSHPSKVEKFRDLPLADERFHRPATMSLILVPKDN